MLLIWKDHMFFLQTAQWKAQDKQHLSPGKSFSSPTLWEGSQSWCCWIRGRWLDEGTGHAQLSGILIVFNPPIFLPYRTPQTSLRMSLVVTHLSKILTPDSNSTTCRQSLCNYWICPSSCAGQMEVKLLTATAPQSTTVSGLELLFEVLLLLLAKVLITLSPLHLMVTPHQLAAIHLFITTWTTCRPGSRTLSLSLSLCTPSRAIPLCLSCGSDFIKWIRRSTGFASLMIAWSVSLLLYLLYPSAQQRVLYCMSESLRVFSLVC
jgi:hypothetical protein